MDERMRIALAEAIGTAILVIGGVGTAVIAGKQVGFQGTAIAFGLSLLVLMYAIGPISGCHVNPAVTLGLAVAKKTKWEDVPWYIVAQLAGAIVGALLIFIVAHGTPGYSAVTSGFGSNGYGRHSPGGYNIPSVAVAEILFPIIGGVLGAVLYLFLTGEVGAARPGAQATQAEPPPQPPTA